MLLNDELREFLEGRSLDPEFVVRNFGLRIGRKQDRTGVRYPTPVGVDRIKFIDGAHPKTLWQRRGGVAHWYGLERARDMEGSIWIVNGEPSVWAAQQEGVAAVCTCAGEGTVPADMYLSELARLDRPIDICLDHDGPGERGSVKLAQALLEFGCDVRVRRWNEFLREFPADELPEDPTGFDVDDLHRLVGSELAEHMYSLEVITVERADKPNPRTFSHWHLAETVLKRVAYKDGPDLLWTDGDFWRYERKVGVWRRLYEEVFDKEVGSLDGFVMLGDDGNPKTLSVRASLISSVRTCAKTQVIERNYFENAPRGVQFRNGFLDAQTQTLRPSSPELRQQFQVNVDYDPAATCPLWQNALEATFIGADDADERIAMIQEAAGAILCGITGKVFFFTGEGANGKSTVLDVLSSLVPDEVRCSIAPHKLSAGHQAEYWVAQLAGKRLNVDADIPAAELIESAEFKKSVTGDELSGRLPGGEPFQFRPRILHLFSANDLPGTRDHTKGFWRRILVLPFERDFEADPDTGVSPELRVLRATVATEEFGREIFRREAAGIIAWAVRGAKRLVERGEFTVATGSKEAVAEWKKRSNQVEVFLDECCNTNVEVWTSSADLYKDFSDWAKRNGHGGMTSTTFGLRLKSLGFTEQNGRKRTSSGRKEYRVAKLAAVPYDDDYDADLPF